MTIDLRYDTQKRILYATLEGSVGVEDFNLAMRKIVTSDEHQPDVATLWDVRSVNIKLDAASMQVPGREKQFLLAMIDMRMRYPERGNAKLAIVVSSDVKFGMSRMYEMLSDRLPQTIMVFRDYAQAEAWLSR